MIVCPLHWYRRPGHLAAVTETMRARGAPVLRGHVVGDTVLLSEGTHRIRAAYDLGLTPVIRAVPWWRTRKALANATAAASIRGLHFAAVEVV